MTSNGEYVILEKTEHEIIESPVKVYNFEVEEFHTYYVGGTKHILVHNACLKIGSGHGEITHKTRIDNFMLELENSGDYSKIYGNRSLSTAGLNGSQRPDVIAIHNDGTYHVWEFASKS